MRRNCSFGAGRFHRQKDTSFVDELKDGVLDNLPTVSLDENDMGMVEIKTSHPCLQPEEIRFILLLPLISVLFVSAFVVMIMICSALL